MCDIFAFVVDIVCVCACIWASAASGTSGRQRESSQYQMLPDKFTARLINNDVSLNRQRQRY